MINTVEVKKQIEAAYKSRNFNAACSAITLVGKARKEKDQNLTDDLLIQRPHLVISRLPKKRPLTSSIGIQLIPISATMSTLSSR